MIDRRIHTTFSGISKAPLLPAEVELHAQESVPSDLKTRHDIRSMATRLIEQTAQGVSHGQWQCVPQPAQIPTVVCQTTNTHNSVMSRVEIGLNDHPDNPIVSIKTERVGYSQNGFQVEVMEGTVTDYGITATSVGAELVKQAHEHQWNGVAMLPIASTDILRSLFIIDNQAGKSALPAKKPGLIKRILGRPQ